MTRLPALTARKVIQALEAAGFFVHHSTGGHAVLRHRTNPQLRVTVPRHPGDLKTGTLHGILRQAGLSPDEFLALL